MGEITYENSANYFIDNIYELKEEYDELVDYWKDDYNSNKNLKMTPHNVFIELITPFIINQIKEAKNSELLKRIFDTLERILENHNYYIEELIQTTLVELFYDQEELFNNCKEFLGKNITKMIEAINKYDANQN